MTGTGTASGEEPAPLEWTRRTVLETWRTVKTVYYANSVSWRALKSGALVFFGFFLWAGSNLLLSYQPTWTVLHYPMAYGFALVVYGPVHHVVVIPLALRLRRRPDDWSRVGRHLPTAGLVAFLAVVVVLGTVPPGVVAVDFASHLEAGGVDINPDLTCTKSPADGTTVVHCHLTESEGIDSVVVESGGRTLATDEDPPFEFTVRADGMTEVVGRKEFQVVLRDEDGATIRRYTRSLKVIPEG